MESLQNDTPSGPPFSTKVQGVCLIPKGAIKKTVIMFAALLMITVLAAFFSEASKKAKLGIRESFLLINEPTDCFYLAC
ncbi:MAG: hypothetical protein ACYS9C_00895 [Planctomycetota bacterium]|jgi:hypothetical protein